MTNFIQQSLEELTLTSTSLTFGYSPGQIAPPNTLVLYSATTGVVTLPPINTVLPATPGSNFVPGCQALKIQIKSLTGQIVTFSSANTSEVFGGAAIVMSNTNATITLLASVTDKIWYNL